MKNRWLNGYSHYLDHFKDDIYNCLVLNKQSSIWINCKKYLVFLIKN